VRGSPWSLFDALLHAPELPLNPAVAIEIVLADITEKRVRDGKGSWRRKGVSIKDRELSVLRESLLYKGLPITCVLSHLKGTRNLPPPCWPNARR